MSRWKSLLAVQGHDIRATQLARRLDTLPERSQLSAAAKQMAAIDAQVAAVDERRGDRTGETEQPRDRLVQPHPVKAVGQRQ